MGLWILGKAQHIENGLALPIAYQAPDRGILGCNFSAWKRDLLAINGFNAEFTGAGWEDTDIDFRLRLVNVKLEDSSVCRGAISRGAPGAGAVE